MNRLVTIFVAGFIALMLLSSTVFVVDQRRYAIVFALGEVREVISEPGLHFKLPPPFQNVIYLDKRILTLDTPDADRFITAEKKNILVDAFVKWRIVDPRLYFVSFSGDETPRARPHVADHQGGAERRDHQAHRARSDFRRARQGDAGDPATRSWPKPSRSASRSSTCASSASTTSSRSTPRCTSA